MKALDFGLAGKTAIITGGTAGIGNETAKYFLVQGDICDAAHREALMNVSQNRKKYPLLLHISAVKALL